MELSQPTDDAIARACDLLRGGNLVAFPTETVYGLGADAASEPALKRLYNAKGRPTDHPVIVHLAAVDQISNWASAFPPAARQLAERFWPGPLTLILPKAPTVLPQITGGQNTVGIRIPSHPVARRLLQAFASGVAAPSANKFGRLSPTCAADVAREFEHEVAMVLDGGLCEVGIESTIVDCTAEPVRILRPGMISAAQIYEAVGDVYAAAGGGGRPAVRAPGMLESHYAPSTPVELVTGAMLEARLKQIEQRGQTAAVLAFQAGLAPAVRVISAPRDPSRYAHELYRNLRQLDAAAADVILVEMVPDQDSWAGVLDRLRRASAK